MMSRLLVLLFSITCVHASESRIPFDAPQDSVVMEWRGVPLQIEIPVKKDRVIRFTQSSRLQVGVPTQLQGIATAETIRGVVHLRTFSAFEQTAFWFRDKDQGTIYRLDITAIGDEGKPPLLIVDPELKVDDQSEIETQVALAEAEPPVTETLTAPITTVDRETHEPVVAPVYQVSERHGVGTLTRYAFQNIYSPDRLIGALEDVIRVPVDDVSYTHLVVGSEVSARTLAQWRNEERYVTALLLRNEGQREVTLDPRRFRGSRYWETASLMSDRLSPSAQYGDVTALVVISDKRWGEYEQWLR